LGIVPELLREALESRLIEAGADFRHIDEARAIVQADM
jgi:hypothetical protein